MAEVADNIKTPFKLSEPGSNLSQDPAVSEYLRCYNLPLPPDIRYGYVRFESRQAKDRVSLFGQAWLPAHAIGTVLLIHGFTEHAGNYAKLIQELTQAKFAVAVLDLRGHGLSEGPRGHTDSPNAYAEDVEQFAEIILPNLNPNRPLFLWAHSLGSMIALQLLLRKKLPLKPHAVSLSSAFVGFPELEGINKILAPLAPILAKIMPTLPLSHGLNPENLSHDKEYLKAHEEDPLIGKVVTPRWVVCCKQAIEEVQKHAKDLADLSPTLFLLAGDERITNLNESRKLAFQAYSQLRHKVIEFPGYRHELEKEPDIRARIVSESIAWFKSHC